MYHKQLWYVSYSTISVITVPLTHSVGVVWTNDLIKHRLAEEKKFFGSYGRGDVRFFIIYIYIYIYVTISIIEDKDVNKLFLYIFSSLIKVQQGTTLELPPQMQMIPTWY